MENKFLKKLIVVLIIMLIIIVIGIIIAISYLNNTISQGNNTLEEGENVVENYGKNENGGIDQQAYYDIKSCMELYLSALNIKSERYGSYDENNNYVVTVSENEIKQRIYNFLSQKYINENNITINNLYNYVNTLKETSTFILLEASLKQENDIKSFLVHGLIEPVENYSITDEIFAIINIDISESKFSIEPIKGNFANISEIQIKDYEDTILSNKDNKYTMTSVKNEDIPKEYMNVYKRLVLSCPQKIYDMLDEEYREKRFGSLDSFNEYVNSNKSAIERITLNKYKMSSNGDNVQYICVDQNEKYYIFNQTKVLQEYTVILDTYTIDLPEFIEKYNKSTDQIKVGMNIEKIIEAINENDYKYVYSKLDNTFKQNKFPTEKDLQKYIKNNFSDDNDIEYLSFSQEGDVYVYQTKINDIKFNIIMQLEEGTEFVMSFSFEE